ncbi:MAG: TonB-dependent receptor plug domain-containing protein [Lentisphaeria bacterium]
MLLLLALMILPGLLPSVLSGAEVEELSDMTVTANKFPAREHNSPQFLQIFTADDLRKTGAQNTIDALRKAGGLGYTANAPLGMNSGMASELSIRGVEKGELVLINGMPVQSAGNRDYNLFSIPLDQIERVEVMKGAASTLYGSDAMSGVINVITESPKEQDGDFYIRPQVGDFNYHNHSFKYSQPDLTLGFNYQHLNQMKYVKRDFEDDEYNHTKPFDSYSFNLSKNFLENFTYNLRGSYTESGFEQYDAVSKAIEKSSDQEEHELFSDLRYQTDDWLVKTFVSYCRKKSTDYDYPPKTLDEIDRRYNFNTGITADYKFDFHDIESRIGAEYIHRAADFENRYGYHYRNDYALYLTMSRTFFERLTLDAGARQQFIDSESGTDDHTEFVPSLGAAYEINENLNWYANTARAFRAPTFNSLYYDLRTPFLSLLGNPSLSPEEGWNYESGFKYSAENLSLRLGVFYMDFEDKIETYKESGEHHYFNADTAESSGIDWQAEWQPFGGRDDFLSGIALNTSGTWMDPQAEDPDGETFQTGAKFNAAVGVDYSNEKFACGVHVPMSSSRKDGLSDYHTVNLNARYQLPIGGAVIIEVDNIFDEKVEINGSKVDGDNRASYGMGRFAKIGYELTF